MKPTQTSAQKRRTAKEMMNESKENVNHALEVGLATLDRIKAQGNILNKQDEYLNPLLNSADEADSRSNRIVSTIQSNKLTFLVCAIIFIAIVYFALHWKHSKSK